MMINCPKCNFLQPKDQYCAQCGVNMETYKPPSKPKWKMLLGNWMVQLGLLFFVIFVVVFLDSVSQQEKTGFEENLPPVSQNIDRQQEESYAASSATEELEIQGQRIAQPQKKLNLVRKQKKLVPQKKQEILKKQAYLRLTTMSRGLLEKISQNSKRSEANILVINKEKLQELSRNNANDMRSMGQNRKVFEFGQPQQLFVGEEDPESGLNIGYFLQAIVAPNSTPSNVQATVRMWSQLQLNGDIATQASYDINMSSDSALIIVDPVIHDFEFTQEERALFDASSKLRVLNSEAFVDALADIVLILSIQ